MHLKNMKQVQKSNRTAHIPFASIVGRVGNRKLRKQSVQCGSNHHPIRCQLKGPGVFDTYFADHISILPACGLRHPLSVEKVLDLELFLLQHLEFIFLQHLRKAKSLN